MSTWTHLAELQNDGPLNFAKSWNKSFFWLVSTSFRLHATSGHCFRSNSNIFRFETTISSYKVSQFIVLLPLEGLDVKFLLVRSRVVFQVIAEYLIIHKSSFFTAFWGLKTRLVFRKVLWLENNLSLESLPEFPSY
jgi:hypothetical protein